MLEILPGVVIIATLSTGGLWKNATAKRNRVSWWASRSLLIPHCANRTWRQASRSWT